MIDNMVKDITAAGVLEKLEEEGKKYCAGTKSSLVWYIISGHTFELPFNYKAIFVNNYASLEEEVACLQHKNADLRSEVDQMQNKEAENERLIGIGEALDKVKTFVQSPCSLEANALYPHM